VLHVSSVVVFSHAVPFLVQFVALQVHAPTPPVVVHVWFAPHVVVPVSARHPFESTAQVASVLPLVQSSPAAVHGAGELQVHADVPFVVVQLWWVPQVAVETHWVQPFDWTSQVSAMAPPLPFCPHCVAPSVHAFVQQAAEPAAPKQTPFVHAVIADS
jgi:hypothetical protein